MPIYQQRGKLPRKRHVVFRQPDGSRFVPFTPESGMSGIDTDIRKVRKGASSAIAQFVASQGGTFPADIKAVVDGIASSAEARATGARTRPLSELAWQFALRA